MTGISKYIMDTLMLILQEFRLYDNKLKVVSDHGKWIDFIAIMWNYKENIQRIFYKLCCTKFNITRLKSMFAIQQHAWRQKWPAFFGLAYIFLQSRAHSSQICCWITKQRGDTHIHWLHSLTPILHKSFKKYRGNILYKLCFRQWGDILHFISV